MVCLLVEEKKSRVVVSLISVGVVLVIGFPVWWNTTKVYRATLPYAEIQQLENLQVEENKSLVSLTGKFAKHLVDNKLGT